MIKQKKISKFKKVVAIYLAMMILLEALQPMQMYALTGGPSQPEFEAFTPIGTSDMVDLASGDFNYNIPIMDVGGYPLNLAYNSGVTMDQEASWVGLGWNLDVGQINRQVRGLPDDFDGDQMVYENNMKPNVTVGANFNVFVTAFGVKEAKASVGLGIKYNNYDGFGVTPSAGLDYQISESVSVGMNISASASEGVSVSPSFSFSDKIKLSGQACYNSRKGLESVTLQADKGPFTASASFTDVNASYTPTKRVAMASSNYMFSANIEGEIWGAEPGVKFTGYRISQGVKNSEKYKIEKAYGFENTYNAGRSDILDFNREKDRTFNKNTTSLPITNNTYDLYSIQGQGISGMYRPYKSQVGYVYDNETNDVSSGGSLGTEVGFGGGVHIGVDGSFPSIKSKSSVWESSNPALNRFKEKKMNRLDYEKVFFKNIGGNHVDQDLNLLIDKLGGYTPVRLNIEGKAYSRSTSVNYNTNTAPILDNNYIARTKRLSRNQSIQKLTRVEALNYGSSKNISLDKDSYNISPFSIKGKHDHHTSEIKITKEGGERYVYGRAAYNVIKKETTFDVGISPDVNYKTGLVVYNNGDNSANNNQGGDQFFNRVTTPSYAHSYLLTSVLSSDYQDLKDDGPTDDDLGTYTKFEYYNKNSDRAHTYKWRIPFKSKSANYDVGFRSSKKDNKGSYIYGEKELLYVKKIVTKTHVAIFHLSERKDGYGVKDENGGLGKDSKMYKLDSISLYSKPEYNAKGEKAIAIKKAHFEYNYSLCQGIDNNIYNVENKDDHNLDGQRGKLTLTKVYFTYKNSKMGKFTPYVFNYAPKNLSEGYNIANDPINNPSYDMKAYDVWGNYKPSNANVNGKTLGDLSNEEFPFVDQNDRAVADQRASVWLLKAIKLPSGGQIEVNFEADDYAFVQDKHAMQMFKVVGSGGDKIPNGIDNAIKNAALEKYIYVEIDRNMDSQSFIDTYLKSSIGKDGDPLYFKFLLNMTNLNALPGANSGEEKYDYVTGYVNIDNYSDVTVFPGQNGKYYASIPLKDAKKGDGFNQGDAVNPISKAGWNFGRKNLSRLVYDMNREEDTKDLKGIVWQLVGWMQELTRIFESPNKRLENDGIATRFIAGKSWIRLMNPNEHKIGGGSRVKNIQLHDQWDLMTGNDNNSLYQQSYGQSYTYTDEKGKSSSGVASYEPLSCKENPLVKPFYEINKRDLLLGPDTDNYVEEPFGESFFPAPKVTYSRVTVTNLPRKKVENNIDMVVKKHATGSVVTEFYTSKDFPTITDRTTLSGTNDPAPVLSTLFRLRVKNHLTLSQGFSIHTNDMDGKMHSQKVYGEGKSDPISEVIYKYSTTSDVQNFGRSRLNNTIQTIDSKGQISEKLVGIDYDVINDFRENSTLTIRKGVNVNTATLPITIFTIVVPTPIPSYSQIKEQMRTATTTKVIHSTGILVEKVAYDLGSKVSTKNLAWDADTGDVLLTQTTNEYNDNYFSFNFPAYWSYDGMSQAVKNAELRSGIEKSSDGYKFTGNTRASDYLINGDEVWVTGLDAEYTKINKRAWIVSLTDTNFKLLDINGRLIRDIESFGTIKVIRSGYRNMQTTTMASITSMRNPLYDYDANNNAATIKSNIEYHPYESANVNNRIVNASAIEYSDVWPSQCECNLPKMVFVDGKLKYEYEKATNSDDDADADNFYNPYLYNILGNWRANKSYAYLTGRNFTVNPTPRKIGFFNDFYPFYVRSTDDNKWQISKTNSKKWTYASEVTQYNPYGQEVENKDALNRYSSAIYGYNNRFPVAVASNTKYNELASDGFEDYNSNPEECLKASHFDFKAKLKLNESSISTTQSHTGRKSLRIEPTKKVIVKKQVIPCK